MTRAALVMLLPALLLALPAAAQLRSGSPAVGSQPPPSSLEGEGASQAPAAPPDDRTGADSPRTEPPSDHQTLEAPSVPGATQPGRSESVVAPPGDPIPARPGARPDAPTTDTQRR